MINYKISEFYMKNKLFSNSLIRNYYDLYDLLFYDIDKISD